jgi:predicted DNA binding CopG/RHH family protein
MSNLKIIPEFKSLEEEAAFWYTHDSADYINWSVAEKTIMPNLKASTETISMRLPAPLLARIKGLANERDVPYQSLMKVFLSERVEQERKAVKK